MRKEEEVMRYMQLLKISDKHPVGKIMAAKGHWTAGASASNNTYKAQEQLAGRGLLEKCNGYFRIPGCASEYGEHARLLTRTLAEILMLPFEATIFREHTIPAVGLRPDALIMLTDHNRALCLVLEAVNHESDRSLETKRNVWHQWPEARQYLRQLFKVTIPQFDFVRSNELARYIQEIVYGKGDRNMPRLFADARDGGLLSAAPENTAGSSGS